MLYLKSPDDELCNKQHVVEHLPTRWEDVILDHLLQISVTRRHPCDIVVPNQGQNMLSRDGWICGFSDHCCSGNLEQEINCDDNHPVSSQ